ncbi:hypothetical protein EVAR_78659_1 [Eumeta japonica]|uniref:Uncharacterized protein n=1 Tax=Eumeta variegata TaxID=151549 RepID=A0A4C1U7W2_EUMVA|nr:hypothetical protein EVAR_78659_1 [Eumeta japonica]
MEFIAYRPERDGGIRERSKATCKNSFSHCCFAAAPPENLISYSKRQRSSDLPRRSERDHCFKFDLRRREQSEPRYCPKGSHRNPAANGTDVPRKLIGNVKCSSASAAAATAADAILVDSWGPNTIFTPATPRGSNERKPLNTGTRMSEHAYTRIWNCIGQFIQWPSDQCRKYVIARLHYVAVLPGHFRQLPPMTSMRRLYLEASTLTRAGSGPSALVVTDTTLCEARGERFDAISESSAEPNTFWFEDNALDYSTTVV